MRTHFPGALHEVRSAARFPLSVVGVWIPAEWRVSKARAGKARMDSYFVAVFMSQFEGG